MALFEVVLKSVYYGQQCVNRWNYISSGTPAAVTLSFALASAGGFISGGDPLAYPDNTLFSGVRSIANADVEFNEVIVNNIYELTDFYTTPFLNNTMGLHSGGAASVFEAAGFRTNLVSRAVARGMKRFVGVPSDQINSGGTLTTTYVAEMQVLADKMAETLEYDDEGNTISFTPAICHKEDYTTPSGKTAYRYFPTLAEQITNSVSGFNWQPYDTIRSQTSRQIGHGG